MEDKNNVINGYIYNVISYEKMFHNIQEDENEVVNFVDVFYINIDDKLKSFDNEISKNEYIVNNCMKCLRFYNFYSCFYLHKLPGMDKEEFKKFVDTTLKGISDIVIKYKTTYKNNNIIDSCYFGFDRKSFYAKIKSKSCKLLSRAHTLLKKKCVSYYQTLTSKYLRNEDDMKPWDKLFFENTETPFRFNMTTLNANNIKYHLSTKYNIPCTGGFTFYYDTSDVESLSTYKDKSDHPGLPFYSLLKHDPFNEYDTLLIDMKGHNNMFKYINHNEHITGQEYLTLLSYDIETYESTKELTEEDKIIMCIGLGIFNITSDKPFIRYCLSLKNLTDEDINKLGTNITTNTNKKHCHIEHIIKNEYSNDGNYLDETHYEIFKTERQMLSRFITLILKYKPTFITGFNNYGFDDRRIQDRLQYYKLDMLMQYALQYYNLEGGSNKALAEAYKKAYKSLYVTKNKFSIKIDGEMYNDNITWIGETKSFITDTYKIMLASNAKLYTQQGRGNLDTMLSVNNIKNPFNGNNLSKSGLSYSQMWYNWDNNKNIYDILLYCCQDAWICGTLLIKSCQLIDKIEMSTLSCTTISDSIFKAVTWRVKHLIEKYAWDNNFAVADSINNKQINDKETGKAEHVSRADNHDLGYKQFDTRQIVGGEVKNIEHGRQSYIIALDFSAMYPSQKEGSNIDTSSMVPIDIINNPSKYGLEEYHDKLIIKDMYKEREIYYIKDNDDNKFVIERFMSEFKNRKEDIRKVLEMMELDKQTGGTNKKMYEKVLSKMLPSNYLEYSNDIYYSGIESTELVKTIKDTEIKYLYTVQSPRDDNNKVVTHYSLKEIMLSDLRSLRSKVKKQMSEATNSLDKNRYNAKQNAIKIMCNSEYGASNSSYFPYYDPLIGGATTAASRCLINFLTNIIQTNKLYVNEKFINTNKQYIDKLQSYCVLEYYKIDHVETNDKRISSSKEDINAFMLNNRRFALRELYDEFYNIKDYNIYVIEIQPSKVVYQDTDSNYYTNEYIKNLLSNKDINYTHNVKQYYCDYCEIMGSYDDENTLNRYENYKEFEQDFISKASDYEDPIIINLKMNLLLNHNNLIGNFIKDSIYRNPVSVGFEGAFIVVRYFNVKKKYYGIVWNDKMKYKLPLECYNDKVLINDYSNCWKPAYSSYPLPNGDYVKIDEDKLIHSDIDKLAYIKSQNVKLTGVDLARRDQYKFINANHIRLIQQDLHFLRYEGNNKWVNISNVNMLDIVKQLLNRFKQQFINIQYVINNMLNNVDCEYDCTEFYNLRDYAKDVTFKYTICNFLVCTNRVIKDGDKFCYSKYPINDTKERSRDTNMLLSYVDTYTTSSGKLRLILERDNDNNYVRIYSDQYDMLYSDIIQSYKAKFYLNKLISESEVSTTEQDTFYIDYDCVKWDKQSKIMITIGDRLYQSIEELKDKYKRRITEQEFNDRFPSGFSRKQYVIMLTDEVRQDRLKGNKSEGVKNSDKAYLIKELHRKYRSKLTKEQYNKLTYHDKIDYDKFIDLQIINDLDHVHYMEAFCSAISLYLIEYANQICDVKDLSKIERGDDAEDDEKKRSIIDLKKNITWNLLITIYPERSKKLKPVITQFKKTKGSQFQSTKISKEEYKRLLLEEDKDIIKEYNERLNNNNKIFIINDDILSKLKMYERIYYDEQAIHWREIINNFYKNMCDVEEDIQFKTIAERCNIIINGLYNQSNKNKERLDTLMFLNSLKEINEETIKFIPTGKTRQYYNKYYKDVDKASNEVKKQITIQKNKEIKTLKERITRYKNMVNYFIRLRNDINKYIK